MTAKAKYADEWLSAVQDWIDGSGLLVRDAAEHYGMSVPALDSALRRYRYRAGRLPTPALLPRNCAEPVHECTTEVEVAAEAPITKPPPGPTARARHYIAAVSCTHYGGRHNCTPELNRFVDWAHTKCGVTIVYHAGDLLQGIDPKWSTEAKRNALDDQCDIAVADLPQRDWLRWKWIGGNHDMKHEHVGGLDVGRYVDWRFDDAGRSDLHYLGPFCGSTEMRIPGAPRPIRIELMHKYGGGENLEPTLRRFVRNLPRKHIPDFVLCGHPHRSAYAKTPFGVHAAFCGTFDVARYGRAYSGVCDIGGVVFGFDLDSDGNPCRVSYQFREYDVEQRV